jgi:soluble lytic murein transglycosylase-like protein
MLRNTKSYALWKQGLYMVTFSILALSPNAHALEDRLVSPPPSKPASQLNTITKPISFTNGAEIITPAKKPRTGRAASTSKTNQNEGYISASSIINGTPRPSQKPLSTGHEGISAKDADLYRRIFSHQQNGDWAKADTLITQLDDFILRGHVLYQKYMHPADYRSSFNELQGWMDLYADHPGANKIYKLALSRQPASFRGIVKKPQLGRILQGVHPDLRDIQAYSSQNIIDSGRSKSSYRRVKELSKSVSKNLQRGRPTAALKSVNEARQRSVISHKEHAHLKAQISASYLHLGYWGKAKALASQSMTSNNGEIPLAGWVLGLTHWKDKQFAQAASNFEYAAKAAEASPWTISAAAYWAARAHMRTGNFKHVNKWLAIGARYPRTFYGILSAKAMGQPIKFNWTMPSFSPAMQRELSRHKGALRAMALMQSGQVHLAEEELKYIHPSDNHRLKEALLAYAHKEELPAYQMRFASIFNNGHNSFYDASLFPIAPWQKQRKTNRGNIDKAVLNAFIRQESRFRSGAENPSGATGLMQIMPSTANYVMGTKRFSDAGRERLKDPQLNMQIGETYIYNLLKQDGIDNDLFSLAIAYNAGPGNLRKWKNTLSRQGLDTVNDPLFFIETFPMSETRSFVERVMTNIWIYRMRLGQPTPSLDAVAQGQWPVYIAMDDSATPNYAFIKSKNNF